MGGYVFLNRTGVPCIDAICDALEHAGHAYHHTDQWGDAEKGEKSELEKIQDAINLAALDLKASGNAATVVPDGWVIVSMHEKDDFPCPFLTEQEVREKALEEAAKICEDKVIYAISKSYAEDERDRSYQECADDLRALISNPEGEG